VHIAPFTGDADTLLGRAEQLDSSTLPGFTVSGGRTTVQAEDGITGVVEDYSSGSGEGLVAAYAFDGVGVTVVVDAASGQLAVHAAEVDAMLRSLAGRAAS
jgi:outer membrane protein TolC